MPVVDIDIPPDHPAFAGHFPGMPIVPGAVLLDETLWAIAASAGVSWPQCTVRFVKFKSVVRPGQAVRLRFEPAAGGGFQFELQSAGRPVASGAISIAASARSADVS